MIRGVRKKKARRGATLIATCSGCGSECVLSYGLHAVDKSDEALRLCLFAVGWRDNARGVRCSECAGETPKSVACKSAIAQRYGASAGLEALRCFAAKVEGVRGPKAWDRFETLLDAMKAFERWQVEREVVERG